MDDQMELWMQQWEQAQAKGVFGEPEPAPAVSRNTGHESFFGMVDAHQKDDPDDFESKYWANVYNTSIGAPPDPEAEEVIPTDGEGVAMIRDHAKGKKVIKEAVGEKSAVGKKAAAMAQSANPIRAASVGMDQDMSPESLGITFTPKDLESLADLKLRLHDLHAKLSAMEGRAQSGKRVETQIQSLVRKINELSDSLSQSFPDEIMHQGD